MTQAGVLGGRANSPHLPSLPRHLPRHLPPAVAHAAADPKHAQAKGYGHFPARLLTQQPDYALQRRLRAENEALLHTRA